MSDSPSNLPEFPSAEDYFASQPSRAFIRVLWGTGTNEQGSRHPKILWDVNRYQCSPEAASKNPPVMCYVFGRENYEFLRSRTFHCKLLSEHPRPCAGNDDPADHAWNHKIIAWQAALADFPGGIVHLDWDIMPLERIRQNYVFDRLAAKGDFGANLIQYKQVVSPWRRKYDRRKKPSAAFVWLANAAVADGIAAAFRETCSFLKCGTEEAAMAWFLDQRNGGWRGLQYWCDHYETFCAVMRKAWGVPVEMGFQKEPLFIYA